MRSPLGAFIFIVLILLLDLYVFQALKTVSMSSSSRTKTIIYTCYWILTTLVIISFLFLVLNKNDFFPKLLRSYIFAIIIGIFFSQTDYCIFSFN